MKSIKVSDKMYSDLVELANEMTSQNHRGTKMPHLFQIRDWKRVFDWNLNGDISCWIYNDGDFTIIETLEDLKHHLECCGIDEPVNLDEMWEDKYDLQCWIDDNCENLSECSYSMEPVYKNSFLTAKAAQEHLNENAHHYHKDADVYLSYAWRNPEAELLSSFICSLVGKKLHV